MLPLELLWGRVMSFLRQNADWLSMLFLAAIFVAFPQIDLAVSATFYDPVSHSWPYAHHPIADSIYALFRYAPHVIVPTLLIVIGLTFVKQGVDVRQRKSWLFLLLVLLIGPGILVHGVFKEGFDRSRPKNIEQFDGPNTFTPAFVISDHCSKGCNSFVSGHSAMGFWFIAFGWVLRRRSWFWFGIAVGVVVSATRIVQGGHFLSDTIFAGYVCYFTCRALGYWFLGRSRLE